MLLVGPKALKEAPIVVLQTQAKRAATKRRIKGQAAPRDSGSFNNPCIRELPVSPVLGNLAFGVDDSRKFACETELQTVSLNYRLYLLYCWRSTRPDTRR